MKILHTVEFYYPSKGGAQEVVQQLSERMVKMGHNVTIATTKLPERKSNNINGVKIVEFDISGNTVVGISGEIEKYQKFLVNSKFDVIMNYAAQQWATDLMFPILDKISAKKFIVPCGYSALHNPDFKNYFNKLPAILKKYNASVYTSGTYQDIKFAQSHGVKNLFVIPNGADENEFDELSNANFRSKYGINNFLVLTIGNHTGSKGHAETIEVFKKFPFTSTLVIIGGKSNDGCNEKCQKDARLFNSSHKYRKILILNASREDTISALKSADIFLFLSNIEASPLVLFEAAAAGVPFITTDVGNSKEIAEWTRGGLIAKTIPIPEKTGNVMASINSSLAKLIWLKVNPLSRKLLGYRARKNWKNHYTWETITGEYLKLYRGDL